MWEVATVQLQPLLVALPLLTPPTISYVIERYWASLKCYVLSIDLKGTKCYFYYPCSIILPCLKLSLFAKLNLELVNLEEVRKVSNFPQCPLSLCFTSLYLWAQLTK